MPRITPILDRLHFAPDQIIMTEGDYGDSAYIIQSGTVAVTRNKNGVAVELARLEPGDIIGETALMFDEPRSATVRAVTQCNLVVITRMMMEDKLSDSDATIRAIVRMMKNRLNAANTERVEKATTDVTDVKRLFDDAFKLVLSHLPEAKRKAYQQEASPILRSFLDLTQRYLNK